MTRQAGDGPSAPPASEVHPGTKVARETQLRVGDRETQPPSGAATGASGGYGVGSDRSSGGSGEPTQGESGDSRATTADDQTDWLRSADGGPSDD
jgi:hypothetical protein